MIVLTKRNHEKFVVNHLQIEYIETIPESKIVMMFLRAVWARSTSWSMYFIGSNFLALSMMPKCLGMADRVLAGKLATTMASVQPITMLYGCILAHMIFGPVANNLRIRDGEEVLCKQIIVEGIMSIQSGENPKALREKLLTYIPQGKREESGKAASGAPWEAMAWRARKTSLIVSSISRWAATSGMEGIPPCSSSSGSATGTRPSNSRIRPMTRTSTVTWPATAPRRWCVRLFLLRLSLFAAAAHRVEQRVDLTL